MKNKFLQILSYVLVACIASVVTLSIGTGSTNAGTSQREMSKLEEVQALIEECFIGETDSTALTDAAASAMVEATGDRWSYYIPADQMQSYYENMNNAYVGIGVTIQQVEEGFEVVEVTAGGPAQEAGILVGDIIYAVEGQKVTDLGMDTARDQIRGEEGTKVNITVLRQGQEQSFTVERRAIEVIVATGQMLDGNIGLVTIENFNSGACEKTVAVIQQLRSQGATALIFDVRYNPGGYRQELVELLDYLLPEGLLFRSEYYTGEVRDDMSDAKYLDMPMAVLVNGDSYSAAEFFAAALSEYEAAVVVGQKTCGKGYFQQTWQLSDGSAVNLSTGKYYTPKGVSLAGVGLTPDISVEVDEEMYMDIYYGNVDPAEDPQIQAAVDALLNQE